MGGFGVVDRSRSLFVTHLDLPMLFASHNLNCLAMSGLLAFLCYPFSISEPEARGVPSLLPSLAGYPIPHDQVLCMKMTYEAAPFCLENIADRRLRTLVDLREHDCVWRTRELTKLAPTQNLRDINLSLPHPLVYVYYPPDDITTPPMREMNFTGDTLIYRNVTAFICQRDTRKNKYTRERIGPFISRGGHDWHIWTMPDAGEFAKELAVHSIWITAFWGVRFLRRGM